MGKLLGIYEKQNNQLRKYPTNKQKINKSIKSNQMEIKSMLITIVTETTHSNNGQNDDIYHYHWHIHKKQFI